MNNYEFQTMTPKIERAFTVKTGDEEKKSRIIVAAGIGIFLVMFFTIVQLFSLIGQQGSDVSALSDRVTKVEQNGKDLESSITGQDARVKTLSAALEDTNDKLDSTQKSLNDTNASFDDLKQLVMKQSEVIQKNTQAMQNAQKSYKDSLEGITKSNEEYRDDLQQILQKIQSLGVQTTNSH